MKAVPYKNPDVDEVKESASLDSKDEQVISDKAGSGDLEKGQEDIDPVLMELDHDTFPQLAGDKEGDKVVMVLVGTVESYTDDSCIVEFTRGNVVHGKLPPLGSGQRFQNLENSLSQKGARNPAALAAWIGRRSLGAAKFNKLSQGGK